MVRANLFLFAGLMAVLLIPVSFAQEEACDGNCSECSVNKEVTLRVGDLSECSVSKEVTLKIGDFVLKCDALKLQGVGGATVLGSPVSGGSVEKEDGKKKASYQMNGECKDWNEEGVLIGEHVYENGEPIKSIEYYESGQMKTLLQLNGDCGEWFENGDKKKAYKFINGGVVGEYKEWYKNGKLMFDNVYDESSNLISKKRYSEDGSSIE